MEISSIKGHFCSYRTATFLHSASEFRASNCFGTRSNKCNICSTNCVQPPNYVPFFNRVSGTGGLTFAYGGVKVSSNASIVDKASSPVSGLFACGEMVGGVFWGGYPGGSGLTSGAVFGKIAGVGAAELALNSN